MFHDPSGKLTGFDVEGVSASTGDRPACLQAGGRPHHDGLSLLDFRKHKPDTPITIVVKHPDSARNGFVFRKGGSELVDAFHTAPDDRMNDGTYQKISEKWFGADVSK
ncbi:transporter substrate-binding domain-containing protein [Brevibacillus thermoruber]|uniref:transporter substrate-binding domain-containing protein n=1 Tax=Brevibacillus thermoruber TaxID=33942 RepID=UPI000A849E4B|nr:transporter substrate-binding domain-containing protein [Brevibacillus thermoruber]